MDNERITTHRLLRRAFCSLFIVLCALNVAAQKSKGNTVRQELSQARSSIKSGKYEEAERLVTTLLKDSANRHDKRIYATWFEAVTRQYEQGNEKLYLKQKYDTAAFFNLTRRLFVIGESLDSLQPELRHRHAAQLNVIRPNLFNGGVYFVRKAKWKEAFDFFESYLDCSRQPLFTTYAYDSIDRRMPEAAYWATYCGYKMNDPVLTLRHRHLALRDSVRSDFTLQFIAEARRWLKDEELYLTTLQEGFRRHPQFPYFFPRLIDVYNSRGQYDRALAAADSALAVCDSCELYLFAESTALLRLHRYRESIAYSDRLIAINDSLPEPYFNAGTAYLQLADGLNQRQDRKLIRVAYQNARHYMERYRELMPSEQNKWAPALYRIYLHLNLGRQFDEIDRLLNNQ